MIQTGVFADVKRAFFDKPAVLRSVYEARRKWLNQCGAILRKTAQFNLKRATRFKVSEMTPEMKEVYQYRVKSARKHGRPKPKRPYKSSGKNEYPRVRPGSLYKKFLYYSYDHQTNTVVAGPVKLSSKSDVPALLEHGGTTHINAYNPITKVAKTKTIRIAPRRTMARTLEKILPRIRSGWGWTRAVR